ncbi:MAG: Plastocyanin [Parcubacteria group bacterium]|nr:Plastocyanin [Parcubacteria group bacterium]
MNRNGWIVLVIIVLVALGGAYAYAQKAKAPTPMGDTGTSAGVETTNPDAATGSTGTAGVGVSAGVSASAKTVTVAYTDQGFSPKNVSVSVGDTVHFVNQSASKMWVASNEHPTHTEYDGTNLQQHCATGGSFDECKAVATGGTYDFTLTKAGTFDFHNHVRASDTGTIVVK